MEFKNNARSRREQRKSSRMARFFRRLRKSQCGGIVEYIIIVAIMAIFAIMALAFLNKTVHYRFVWVADCLRIGKTAADAKYQQAINGVQELPPDITID